MTPEEKTVLDIAKKTTVRKQCYHGLFRDKEVYLLYKEDKELRLV